jgi:hypothetical protein
MSTLDEVTATYMHGDIRHYLSLFDHPEDNRSMPPYGGETEHGCAA